MCNNDIIQTSLQRDYPVSTRISYLSNASFRLEDKDTQLIPEASQLFISEKLEAIMFKSVQIRCHLSLQPYLLMPKAKRRLK